MGLSIVFHGSEDGEMGPFDLSSAVGWQLFGEWVESLPYDISGGLRELVESGEVDSTARLSKELNRALLDHHPENEGVENTAYELLDRIGVGHEDEKAVISND